MAECSCPPGMAVKYLNDTMVLITWRPSPWGEQFLPGIRIIVVSWI